MEPDHPVCAAVRDALGTDLAVAMSIPGAVVAVCGADRVADVAALGVDAAGTPLVASARFPLGSATKLATGLLVLRMVEEGTLDLDAPLSTVLPEASVAHHAAVTSRRLLTHTSGLGLEVAHDLSTPPGSLSYEAFHWPGAVAAACLAATPVSEPGAFVSYSNIGYGLLGLIAERLLNAPFAELLETHVFRPLGITATCGGVPEGPRILVSDVPGPHAGTEREPYNSRLWVSNGTPWAGVSTDARGLLALVCAFRDDSLLLKPATARDARADHTGGVPGGFRTTEAFVGHSPSRQVMWKTCPWGLGVELQGGRRPHWGPAKLPGSFGHIGSSGCLAWCDPDSGRAWAILGARTTDRGWLLLHGPRIAQAALAAAH